MRNVFFSLLVLTAAVSGNAFSRDDVAAGQFKSGICASCHGVTGMSPTDEWPSLAGQRRAYLVKQLKAFREGTRKNALMQTIAKPLSDEDIENLAGYYSTQKAGVVPASAALTSAPAGSAPVPHPPIITSDIVAVRPHPLRQYWADQLPEDEGREIVLHKCQLCHDLQRTLAFVRPKDQWQDVIEAMIRRGSPVTSEEIPVLVGYFTKHFGPDSPPIRGPGGHQEIGMRACKVSEWPKGSSDFRANWKGSYNIWVSNQQGGSIDIVDPITKKAVNRITCISAPDRVEFSRDGNMAYAPDRVEHNITVIDTRTGAIKAKIPLIARPNTAVLSRDFKKLYAGIWPVRGDEDSRGYVQIVDTDKLQVVKTIETKGGIHDTWMSPDGKLLLAMAPQAKFMNVYDTKTDKLLYTCCVDGEIGTMNVEAGPDGSSRRIFFSYFGYYGIVVVDAATGKELMRIPHPHKERMGRMVFHGGEIARGGKDYWVIVGSYLYRYELPSFKYLGEVPLALIDQAGQRFTPQIEGTWLTISPDGQKVYAVRPGRNLLSVVDVKTMQEEALVPTGEYPLHISIWPRGTP